MVRRIVDDEVECATGLKAELHVAHPAVTSISFEYRLNAHVGAYPPSSVRKRSLDDLVSTSLVLA